MQGKKYMNETKESIQEQTLARLRRVEGQIRGVGKMIEEERGCVDILRQLAAADAALRSAAKHIVSHHMDCCFEEATRNPETRQRLFKELLETFGRFG